MSKITIKNNKFLVVYTSSRFRAAVVVSGDERLYSRLRDRMCSSRINTRHTYL